MRGSIVGCGPAVAAAGVLALAWGRLILVAFRAPVSPGSLAPLRPAADRAGPVLPGDEPEARLAAVPDPGPAATIPAGCSSFPHRRRGRRSLAASWRAAGEPGEQVMVVLRWADGTELARAVSTLSGEDGHGLVID